MNYFFVLLEELPSGIFVVLNFIESFLILLRETFSYEFGLLSQRYKLLNELFEDFIVLFYFRFEFLDFVENFHWSIEFNLK